MIITIPASNLFGKLKIMEKEGFLISSVFRHLC